MTRGWRAGHSGVFSNEEKSSSELSSFRDFTEFIGKCYTRTPTHRRKQTDIQTHIRVQTYPCTSPEHLSTDALAGALLSFSHNIAVYSGPCLRVDVVHWTGYIARDRQASKTTTNQVRWRATSKNFPIISSREGNQPLQSSRWIFDFWGDFFPSLEFSMRVISAPPHGSMQKVWRSWTRGITLPSVCANIA